MSTTPQHLRAIAGPDRPLIHSYPRDARYRRSGATPPQPGDIAYCGHVKVLPGDVRFSHMPVECVVCAELRQRAHLARRP
jgi:hypothetical protein